MNIIDGKAISEQIKQEVKIKAQAFRDKFNRQITLAVILVGENPASKIYVNNKIKTCEYVGIKSLAFTLPETATFGQIKQCIESLAENDCVDGILVQLPLPDGINKDDVLNLIPIEKDVDGFLPANMGNLILGQDCTVSCTPFGVMKLLEKTGVKLAGKNAVVIGRSNIVGKPMAALLLNADCTVTVCHSKTENLADICKKADILVASVGKAGFVKENMVKEGAIVIDVGISRVDGKIKGDVDFDAVVGKCSYITPVPGGVGPMTIAMLMENTYRCALKRELQKQK